MSGKIYFPMISSILIVLLVTSMFACIASYCLKLHIYEKKPGIKNLGIDYTIDLPIIHTWTFASLFAISLAILPERDNLYGLITSDLATMGLSDDEWEQLYLWQKIYGATFICVLIATFLNIRAVFHRQNISTDKLKVFTLIISVLSAISLFINFADFMIHFIFAATGSLSNKAVFFVCLISFIAITTGTVILQRRYNKAIDLIFNTNKQNSQYTNVETNIRYVQNTKLTQDINPVSLSNEDSSNEPDTKSVGITDKAKLLFGLKELLDSGVLTQEEFDNEKQKILNS